MAALRSAGHAVALLAPASSGSALVGPGPSEATALMAWDRAEVAALLSEGGVSPGPLQDALATFDVAVAFTRSATLVRNLAALVPRVVAHDPTPPPQGGHASAWLARPVAALGLSVPECPGVPTATQQEQTQASALLESLPEGFLAVHPGSGSAAKNWPAERFASVVAARSGERPWLLVEGPADREAAARLRLAPNAIVARDLPPRVLGAILGRAGFYLGNDSGVSHLAAAWGAPGVALFGPTDPALWAPVGPKVRVVRSDSGRMDGIPVEAVLAVT